MAHAALVHPDLATLLDEVVVVRPLVALVRRPGSVHVVHDRREDVHAVHELVLLSLVDVGGDEPAHARSRVVNKGGPWSDRSPRAGEAWLVLRVVEDAIEEALLLGVLAVDPERLGGELPG